MLKYSIKKFMKKFSGVPDYVQTTVDTVLQIHRNEPAGDILAFLTGQVTNNKTFEISRFG